MAPRNNGKPSSAKIIPFPSRSTRVEQHKIVRISPEYEGLCLLYSHHALSRDKLYAVKILAWARLANGQNVAILPWLSGISRCIDLNDPDTGLAQGYYDPRNTRHFSETPPQHIAALDAMCQYPHDIESHIIQEIPDLIGSHAALLGDKQEFILEPVISWRLLANGKLEALVADVNLAQHTPVLAQDECLYPVQQETNFRYFFQYHIANQIKAGGQIATRAISQLLT
ncbi:Uncharacterised protein [Zhongshania aliphaticivorans]|uniref:Uncharacterized protein n=1 Tax=Zhongshania aliphaticivorans TaxID=1470434 RepID=A0A5S9NZV4_9GAMM|nr:hypothetical protein [Zhongshania aliphaticivorans]CAA0089584.1 Uncharacterised protein [Zhongshania aliphaticivorans]CAA0096444.1 Uncharacterised protein [Zhongshania aliphaticivorans]